ncbi:MAG: restriction endonuclease subunit S, partial [Deltaproteobacteria bacterium]|nr:restriction endonuclease subunit S [Deltaproteobacteria bacterium]
LAFFLRTGYVVDAASAQQVGINLPRVRPDVFDHISIPLPPLAEQARIVAKLERIEQARRAQKKAIQQTQALLKAALAQVFDTKDGLSNEREVARLGDVTLKTEFSDPRKSPDEPFRYVDIASVDNETGQILEARELLGRDAPSRARKRIQAGDVIVATTRPYLRGVADVPSPLDGQICSTGFCVLRSNGSTNQRFLYFFARSDFFIRQLSARMRGASYPAVTDRDVFESDIVFPPLPVQHRVVAKLDRIQRALKLQRDALGNMDALMQSALHSAFHGKL